MLCDATEIESVYLSERETARLRDDCDRLEAQRLHLQDRLDELVPKHEAIRQAFNDSRGSFGLSALFLTLGGASISVAGAISNPSWKPILLWGGIATAGCRFLLSLSTMVWIKP